MPTKPARAEQSHAKSRLALFGETSAALAVSKPVRVTRGPKGSTPR
jgi:hypothetical protein